MNERLQVLQSRYPKFQYQSYAYSQNKSVLSCQFIFSAGGVPWTSKLSIDFGALPLHNTEPATLDHLVFNLGLIESLSYWKAVCSPRFVIKAGPLSSEQKTWWQNLQLEGLGEFFVRNEIDAWAQELVNWEALETASVPLTTVQLSETGILIPVGGGKDSIVSIELLKTAHEPLILFALNPIAATQRIFASNPEIPHIIATRQLDPNLLDWKNQGYLNGHTPYSAYLAFLTTLTATVAGLPYVAVSNEASANEGNMQTYGHTINHQYSKSFAFEQSFVQYSQQHLFASKHPEYFSLLRPLNELQIARLFAEKADTYFSSFRSCNVGSHQDVWCHHCAKCLFAYLMLFPYIERSILDTAIFQQGLFLKVELVPIALQLIDRQSVKPWDCVGTYDEVCAAVLLATEIYEARHQPLPPVLQAMLEYLPAKNQQQQLLHTVTTAWHEQHIPEHLQKIMRHAWEALL